MNKKSLIKILLAEIAVVGIVTALFRFIPNKREAGVFAGLAFIGIGVWINIVALRWRNFYGSLTLWVTEIHLFVSAIPLFVYRLIFFHTGFDQLKIFGIPGPQFHRFATFIYLSLMASTVIDILHLTFERKKPVPPADDAKLPDATAKPSDTKSLSEGESRQ